MPSLPAINNLRTSLSSALNALDTVAQVSSTVGWPSNGIFSVDDEIIFYTSVTVTTFGGLVRGFDNTQAAGHAFGSIANLRIVAKHINDAGFLNPDPTTATVGGIPAGSTFPERLSVQEMMERLLYPYQFPAFTSFVINGQNPPFEVGYTVPASVFFTWGISSPGNVQPNTVALLNLTDGIPLISGLANDGSEPIMLGSSIQKTSATTHQFRISATNTQAGAFQNTLTLSWQWRLRYGIGSTPVLNAAAILSLSSNLLATAYGRTYPFPATGYKYICQADAAGGQISSAKDQSTGFNVPFADSSDNIAYNQVDGGGFSYALVSVTNGYGVVQNYRVYRTKNVLGGAITIVVT